MAWLALSEFCDCCLETGSGYGAQLDRGDGFGEGAGAGIASELLEPALRPGPDADRPAFAVEPAVKPPMH